MNKLDTLLTALENDKTNNIMKTSKSEIKEEKNDILQQLQLPRELLKEYHEKLKNYRYINNIDGLESGHYIRWINLKDIEKSQQSPKHKQLYIPPINKGGYLCDIDVINDDVHLIMKSIYNRHFILKMSEVLVFKRLTDDEQIILSAMKYIQKNT